MGIKGMNRWGPFLQMWRIMYPEFLRSKNESLFPGRKRKINRSSTEGKDAVESGWTL